MNTRDAWRWPLRSRARLIALVLGVLALALITKTIIDNGTSTAAPTTSPTVAPTFEATTATTKPTTVPTNPDECVAQWPKGPDRDACLYREYGYTPSPEPTRNRTTGSSSPPVVIGIPVITTAASGDIASYVPEVDQTAALDVTARFVDAWYAGGSDAAWRDAISRWADPTLIAQLATTDRQSLPGSKRVTEPAMRGFEPGLASTGVATDAGSLAITVIYTDNGWRVVTVTTERR